MKTKNKKSKSNTVNAKLAHNVSTARDHSPNPQSPAPRKTRSDASWNSLTAAQRSQLEHWLFEQNLSFTKTLALAKKQFGYQGAVSSLRRFRKHIAEARALDDILHAASTAKDINNAGVHTTDLSEAAMKIVAQLFLHHATTQPDQPKQWAFYAKLVLRHQADQSRAILKHEENNIRHAQQTLAREKWQDILNQRTKVEKADQDAADKQALETELKQRETDNDPGGKYDFNRRSNRMRYKVFGEALDFPNMWNPESIEEEAALEALKKLPEGISEKKRQRIARTIFNRTHKRVIKEEQQEAEEAAAERARIQRHYEERRQAEAQADAQRQARAQAAAAQRPQTQQASHPQQPWTDGGPDAQGCERRNRPSLSERWDEAHRREFALSYQHPRIH